MVLGRPFAFLVIGDESLDTVHFLFEFAWRIDGCEEYYDIYQVLGGPVVRGDGRLAHPEGPVSVRLHQFLHESDCLRSIQYPEQEAGKLSRRILLLINKETNSTQRDLPPINVATNCFKNCLILDTSIAVIDGNRI